MFHPPAHFVIVTTCVQLVAGQFFMKYWNAAKESF